METTRSAYHRAVERWLTERGISYSSEHTEFTPYQLDLYFPEWHCCVEIDGPHHTPKKDDERDAALRDRYYIPTARIKCRKGLTREIALGIIIGFIEHCARDADERKQLWRESRVSTR